MLPILSPKSWRSKPVAYSIFADAPNIFSPFKSIAKLTFTSSPTGPSATLRINDQAFYEGQQVTAVSINGFENVFPIMGGLTMLAKNGLTRLEVKNGQKASLVANGFIDFQYLTSLSIQNTQLSIDELAFASLEDTLTELALINIVTFTYPQKAISRLTKLQRLDLSWNDIYDIPAAAFAPLTDLRALKYSGNINQYAVKNGAFNNLSPKLESFDLDSGNLYWVPADLLATLPRLTHLSMANNAIYGLYKNYFPATVGSLTELDVSGNPIASIEAGVFDDLKSITSLGMKKTTLVSIDLSMLHGMPKLENLALDQQQTNSFEVKITDPNQVPNTIHTITLSQTKMSTINRNFESIVSNDGFKLLDLTYNDHLSCDPSLAWIAKYALCLGNNLKIDITGTTCANLGQSPLKDYLHEIVPNSC